jgi:hypothetical protein
MPWGHGKIKAEALLMLVIAVGNQGNGATFQLTPKTRKMLESRFPGWSSAPTSVFVSYNRQWDFKRMHDPMWSQIVMLLTRLSGEQIRDLGGFQFVSPADDDEIVYESHAA